MDSQLLSAEEPAPALREAGELTASMNASRLGVIDGRFANPVADSEYRLAAELPQETTP